MSGPTYKETRPVDPVLTGFVESFMNAQTSYLAFTGDVFPILTTDEATGTYFKWDVETFFSRANAFPEGGDLLRGIGAPYQKAPPRELSTGTYAVQDYGESDTLDLRQERIADSGIDLREAKTMALMHDVLIAAEQRLVDIVQATASLSQNTTLSGTDQWDDYDSSDPIAKINTGIETIQQAVGGGLGVTHELRAVTRPDVWHKLQFHPLMQGKVASVRNAVLTEADMMSFFSIDKLLIAKAVDNTVNAGQAGVTAWIWSDDFTLYAYPKTPNKATYALGYVFEQRGIDVETDRKDIRTDEITVSHEWAEEFVSARPGYLIKDCLST